MILSILSMIACMIAPLVIALIDYAVALVGGMNLAFGIISIVCFWASGVAFILSIRWFKDELDDYKYIKELEKELGK